MKKSSVDGVALILSLIVVILFLLVISVLSHVVFRGTRFSGSIRRKVVVCNEVRWMELRILKEIENSGYIDWSKVCESVEEKFMNFSSEGGELYRSYGESYCLPFIVKNPDESRQSSLDRNSINISNILWLELIWGYNATGERSVSIGVLVR